MEDIEDLVFSNTPTNENPPHNKIVLSEDKNFLPKNPETPQTTLPDGIPGTQSVFVKTWGCAHNSSDSEYMAGVLQQKGYKIVESGEEADVWVLNSCTVKGPSQQKFVNEVAKAKKLQRHLVVAGCIPQAQKSLKELEGLSMIGVQQIDRIAEVVEETLKGHSVQIFATAKKSYYAKGRMRKRKDGGASLELPKVRKNPLVEIVPINTGCLNNCTYCKTKQARGDLGSYDPEEITERIDKATREEGVREVWLVSEDLGAYGLDIGTNIAELLSAILKILPKNAMLRIGMTNPPYILEHLEAISKVLNQSNVYSFLHVPVQSGSDRVLTHMRRKYLISGFCKVVDFMKEKVPDILIATDIICGYPTETEQEFDETMALCEKYKFPKLHISQFYPRHGTPAAKMKRIPTNIVKSRSKKLTKLFDAFKPEDSFHLGKEMVALITEKGLGNAGEDMWVGRNKSYRKVFVPVEVTGKSLMGRFVKIRVTVVSKFYIKGVFLSFCEGMDDSLEDNRSQKGKYNLKTFKNKISNENWSRLICVLIILCIVAFNIK